jgi:hypothetical protein
MLKKILLALVLAVVVLVIVVAMQPADYRVARTATIAAPNAVVFEQVNNLHKWQDWSPWAKIDPAAKNSYEGPESGVGAAFIWSGNSKVGEGRMTITNSRPHERVAFRLEFQRPMTATCMSEFTFKPKGEQTEVTWTMTGKNDFIGKAFSLVMNCDKMLGGDFEKGLAQLDAAAKAAAKK